MQKMQVYERFSSYLIDRSQLRALLQIKFGFPKDQYLTSVIYRYLLISLAYLRMIL